MACTCHWRKQYLSSLYYNILKNNCNATPTIIWSIWNWDDDQKTRRKTKTEKKENQNTRASSLSHFHFVRCSCSLCENRVQNIFYSISDGSAWHRSGKHSCLSGIRTPFWLEFAWVFSSFPHHAPKDCSPSSVLVQIWSGHQVWPSPASPLGWVKGAISNKKVF